MSRRLALLAIVAGCPWAAPGCVERLLQVRSDPPGAEVFVNGRRAGMTPLDHRFDFYGTFDVTVRTGEHGSVHRLEPIRPPWYEIPPLDFFVENLVPFTVRDHRELRYVLEPAPAAEAVDRDRESLRERARDLEARLAGGAEGGAAGEAPAEPGRP